jgi:altronate dehydratase
VEHFAEKVMAVASGEKTCNELNGDHSIAIFKDGVTL